MRAESGVRRGYWKGVLLIAVALTTAGCINSRRTFRVPEIVDPSIASKTSSLYEEVLAGLNSAEAYARVEFDAGQVDLGRGVSITLPDDLSAGAWLSVDSGRVLGGRIEFTKQVRLEPMQGVPMSFRRLAVSATGEVDPIDLRFDSAPHRLLLGGEISNIRGLIAEQVRVPTDVRAVLADGDLFGSPSSTVAYQEGEVDLTLQEDVPDYRIALAAFSEPNSEPTRSPRSSDTLDSQSPAVTDSLTSKIREIRLRVSDATFHAGTVLLLHDYGRRDSVHRTRLVVGPESSATIPHAVISPREKELRATIDLSLKTLNSSIVTDEGRFDFGTGSTLIARGLQFWQTNENWGFKAPPGSGYAELQLRRAAFAIEGSDLTLKQDGSTILLSSLDLSGSSAMPDVLQFSGAGRMTLQIESGNLHFNTLPGGVERSYLRVGDSRLTIEGKLLPLRESLEPVWRVRDGTATADINIESGVIDLNDAGTIICGSGTVLQSAAIDFDTSKDINFAGSLSRLHVPEITARLEGEDFASVLRLDPQSSILLGGNSSLTLTDVILKPAERLLQGRLTASLEASGGRLVVGASSFMLANVGSRVLITDAGVDTTAPRFISGLIDEITCVVKSTDITLGDSVRSLSLAVGSRAVLSDLLIDSESGSMKGRLALDAEATNGGMLHVGPGESSFPIRSGGRLRASDLELNSDTNPVASGMIQEIHFVTEGGQLDFAAITSEGRGSGFLEVAGNLVLQDISFPQRKDGSGGRGTLGLRNAPIQFSQGNYDTGSVRVQLSDGSLRGTFAWETKQGKTSYDFTPESLIADFSATLSQVQRNFGTESINNPFALATGRLSLSGDTTRFKFTSGPSRVAGSFSSPYVDEASGTIAIECIDSIAFDAVFDGRIYIPCDGDAHEGGAKTYQQWLAVQGDVDPGWRFAGQFDYKHGGSPTVELAERSGNPLRLSLQNVGGGANPDGDLVTIFDYRKMNRHHIGVHPVRKTIKSCDRVTVRWHKGYSWTVDLNAARLRLDGEELALSADLQLVDSLEVRKYDPSNDGLSWDGNPRVEAADIFLKAFGFGSVSGLANDRISGEALPAIKAKLAELRFSID